MNPFRSVLVLALALSACQSSGPVEHVVAGEAMGTSYSVKLRLVQALDDAGAERVAEAIADEIELVNQKMSTYLDTSELSRLNQAPASAAIAVSAETMAVFLEAQRIGELTNGVFDITVGPLVNAWGFGPEERRVDLSEQEIGELQALTGWERITLDEAALKISKDQAGVYCDLSAIAKGYAVDRVSESLNARGYGDHMVELGGEIRVRGAKPGASPWKNRRRTVGAPSSAFSRSSICRWRPLVTTATISRKTDSGTPTRSIPARVGRLSIAPRR